MTDQSPAEIAKDAAARAAVALIEPGMKLGLGTGSTAAIMVRHLAERARQDRMDLVCAATSAATADLAGSLGLRVEELDRIGWLDLTIDGADEVDPDLNLIKGGGGALLREKIVACASDRVVVVADKSKVVEQLGAFHLPVEVIPFGAEATKTLIDRVLAEQELDQRPVLLRKRDDHVFRTDEGNLILDLALEAIPHPNALARALNAIPGVVENGLFLGIAELALVGREDGSVVELIAEERE